jgi:hypothetical protein
MCSSVSRQLPVIEHLSACSIQLNPTQPNSTLVAPGNYPQLFFRWKTGLDGCNFPGVSCSGDVKGTYVAVVSIDVQENHLEGNISGSKFLSRFAGASLSFAGNKLSGVLPNPCARTSGSPAYAVDFSRNELTAYDGSGMGMVSYLNLSHNRIGSAVEPLLTQLLTNGFFIEQFDLSHNLLVGDAGSLGDHHPWERLETGYIDLSDNCLSGDLSWLNKSWYDKEDFEHFNLSGNYWTAVPEWCAHSICRPETRSRASKGCATPSPPSPSPPPAPSLVVPQQMSSCVSWTHYYTDGSSQTQSQGLAVDVPGQRQMLLQGTCFGGPQGGTSSQLQLGKKDAQYDWTGYNPNSSCTRSPFNKTISFYSDTTDYVYKGVDTAQGPPAHHWVTYPGNPYKERNVWQAVNQSSGWNMWVNLGDFSNQNTRYGQWVYRWSVGVQPDRFLAPCE